MSPSRLIPLMAALLPVAASAQVVINEIAAATSDRIVRYDERGAPHLGHDPQWHAPTFDASAWPEGEAPIGSGGNPATRVGRDAVSLYGRTTFQANASQAGSNAAMTLNVTYDDGFIAYINGIEVGRSNLGPEHAIAYHDQSAYNPNSNNTATISVPNASGILIDGQNTLAIQAHASGVAGGATTRLDASLTLASPSATLVPAGSSWSYFSGVTEPSAAVYDDAFISVVAPPPVVENWRLDSFDDSRWESGNTPIGYDTGTDYPLQTNVVAEMRSRATSLYFRAEFELTQQEVDAITSLTLPTDFDDGIAVYINGFEVGRSNLGTAGSNVPHTATAENSHNARYDNGGNNPAAVITFFPGKHTIRAGTNILAVQLHNNSVTSSDLFASLTLNTAGLGRTLVADGHPVSYFIGTEAPTSTPGETDDDGTPRRPRVTDWIELHNPTAAPVDLEGWSLTDSPGNLDQWVFPAVTIEPDGYLLVLASGRDKDDPDEPLQTDFRLSASGEFLALVRPDGTIADSLGDTFPAQSYFHSFGRDASGSLGYFATPSPGKPNAATNLATLLAPPVPDLETGFYPDHVAVALNLDGAVPGATVRYTIDGTDPTESNGFDYTSPVQSNRPVDVRELPGTPGTILREVWTGIPGTSVDQIPTATRPDLSFQSNALSTPPDWVDNFGDRFRGFLIPPATGDYSFWISSGDSSEVWLSTTASSADKQRIASVPSRTNSREWDRFPSQHSAPVRLEAGETYYFETLRKAGTGNDHFAVAWDGPGIDRTVIFGQVIAPLIVPQTNSSAKSLTLKARTFAPGHAPSEVVTRSYLINHDPRFAQNNALLISGDPGRSLFQPNGATARVGGSGTWSPNNPTTDYNMAMEEGRPYERPVVFEFLKPGNELAVRNGAAVRIAGSPHARPRYNYTDLEGSNWLGSWTSKPSLNFFFRDELGEATVDYPIMGPDRVSSFSDFRLRAGNNDSNNPFIKDELMRRLSGATGQPASRGVFLNMFVNGHYKAYFNLTERLRENFFQEHYDSDDGWDIWHIREIVEGDRTHYDATMNLLRTRNFADAANYAEALTRIDPVSYIDYILVNAYGATGDWPHNNYNLARERSPEGRWKFNVWDAEGAFGGFGHGITWNTFTSDLLNGSQSSDGHMTRLVYKALRTNPEFRLLFADRIQKHFFGDGGLTQESIRQIYLETLVEFAPVLRVARNTGVNESFFNNWWPSRRNILFGHLRSQGLWPDTTTPNFSRLPGEVTPGTGITMANLNASGTIYYTTDSSDPRQVGGGIAGSAYNGTPVPITKSTVLKARVRIPSGEWSPLREILYTTPEPPALAITELSYNPPGTDDLEFIEIRNTGTSPVNLSGIAFTNGVDFTFGGGTLAPGAYAVIVKDQDAFAAAYPGVTVAGVFAGSLDNAGERLTLSEPGGRTIFSVRYNDRAPWPVSADGEGATLVLHDPSDTPDPEEPGAWRPGVFTGGTPGFHPPNTFATWLDAQTPPVASADPQQDLDGDQIPLLLEYALGLNPHAHDNLPLSSAPGSVSFESYLPALDVTLTLKHSPDLTSWETIPLDTSPQPTGTGTATHTYGVEADTGFFQVEATLQP